MPMPCPNCSHSNVDELCINCGHLIVQMSMGLTASSVIDPPAFHDNSNHMQYCNNTLGYISGFYNNNFKNSNALMGAEMGQQSVQYGYGNVVPQGADALIGDMGSSNQNSVLDANNANGSINISNRNIMSTSLSFAMPVPADSSIGNINASNQNFILDANDANELTNMPTAKIASTPANVATPIVQPATSPSPPRTQRSARPRLQCTICGQTLARRDGLKRHMISQHPMPTNVLHNPVRTRRRQRSAKTHAQRSAEAHIQCRMCDQKVSTRTNLFRHMRTVHHTTRTVLHACHVAGCRRGAGSAFTRRDALRRHLRFVHDL